MKVLLVVLAAGAPWAMAGCGSGPAPAGMPAPVTCTQEPGNICTVAGTGQPGDGTNGRPPLETDLYLPQDMTLGPDGRLFVVDWNNHRVRVIDGDGRMRIVAGSGDISVVLDDPSNTHLNHPTSVAFNPMGPPSQMVVAAWHNNRIEMVDLSQPPDSNVVDLCGTGTRGYSGDGGPAVTATLDQPVAAVFDPAGNLLVSDEANQTIRIVHADTGIIETLAGTGHCEDTTNPAPCVLGDGGPAVSAGFHFFVGQTVDPGGRIALDAAGNIYVADTANFRVRKIDTSGTINTFAGNGTAGFAGDGGPATEAQLGPVTDVAVGLDGAVYIVDSGNHCVRVVSAAGTISTFAGRCGQQGFTGDGGPATMATLNRPAGVDVTDRGDVYVADTHNQRIRVVYH